MPVPTPRSTYRLQLHVDFPFTAATEVAQYMKQLGASHVYTSPYLQAQPGSMHGYDVVSHGEISTDLGGDAGRKRFTECLRELGLGHVLDIVPNHMSAAEQNKLWIDVLENGPSSRFSSFFDIDWNSAEERLRDKVMLPVLGDQYGRAIARGEFQLKREGSSFSIRYFDHSYPVAPRSLAPLLARAAKAAGSDLLAFLADSFARLPAPDSTDRSVQMARHRDKTVLYTQLERLCSEQVKVCDAIEETVMQLNRDADAMDALLNEQNYRLAFWRTSDEDLGYRRFFDVNTLVGVRQEREYVFEETHRLILEWLKDGTLDGVRIDHPDGLRDPEQYFARLRQNAPNAWIVAEKILEPGEWLREAWPIEGTTGYDFANVCNHLLVEPEGLDELTKVYTDFTKQSVDFPTIAFEKKAKVAKELLAADVNRLATLFVSICENNRESRDYTRAEIRRAIRAVAACYEVYRTYVVAGRNEITDEDRARIDEAVEQAKQRRPEIDAGLFDFLRNVLNLAVRGTLESEFVARFQQFTSPVMAKGVEDTAFYCFDRLTSLNEVGGDPARRGLTIDEFHAYQTKMQATHPATMTGLSTHDTKRSDDVRARLAVLTEVPERFRLSIRRWQRMNHGFKTGRYPDVLTEYFFYQTVIGAWPISAERLRAYMLKAMRESKLETSWMSNNEEYESALAKFIDGALGHQPFVADMEQFVARINRAGRVNSLAQTLLKSTGPGVPDLYQGAELWDHSLVDPDNRRPVDYDLRRWLLGELQALTPEQYTAQVESRFEDGTPKLWTIHHSLVLRNERPDLFGAEAAYTPVEVKGKRAQHALAYLRGDAVLTLVPRFPYKLNDSWGTTWLTLPAGMWTNRLTGEQVQGGRTRIARLLEKFPVALLLKEGA